MQGFGKKNYCRQQSIAYFLCITRTQKNLGFAVSSRQEHFLMYGENCIVNLFQIKIILYFQILNMQKINCLIYNVIFVVQNMLLLRKKDTFIVKMMIRFPFNITKIQVNVGLELQIQLINGLKKEKKIQMNIKI